MTRPSDAAPRPLTGRAVLVIALAAFGVVLAVNLTMAWLATSGFPGLVVPNSYVASQSWDRTRAAQQALGWRVAARLDGDALVVTVTGADGRPVRGLAVTADIARPAGRRGERVVTLTETPAGYRAAVALAPGNWAAEIRAAGPGDALWTGTARLWRPEG
ncbi:MAG: nitrogen fixation protein FixH [Alphaproteobacteria bacterium]|nr:MAG: nitrogen fixation protein FixH [Alphaproteobacteria bacterium]